MYSYRSVRWCAVPSTSCATTSGRARSGRSSTDWNPSSLMSDATCSTVPAKSCSRSKCIARSLPHTHQHASKLRSYGATSTPERTVVRGSAVRVGVEVGGTRSRVGDVAPDLGSGTVDVGEAVGLGQLTRAHRPLVPPRSLVVGRQRGDGAADVPRRLRHHEVGRTGELAPVLLAHP